LPHACTYCCMHEYVAGCVRTQADSQRSSQRRPRHARLPGARLDGGKALPGRLAGRLDRAQEGAQVRVAGLLGVVAVRARDHLVMRRAARGRPVRGRHVVLRSPTASQTRRFHTEDPAGVCESRRMRRGAPLAHVAAASAKRALKRAAELHARTRSVQVQPNKPGNDSPLLHSRGCCRCRWRAASSAPAASALASPLAPAGVSNRTQSSSRSMQPLSGSYVVMGAACIVQRNEAA